MSGSFDLAHYERERARLIDAHAYDPTSEHDACGVGLVCAIDGKPRREVVELAIRALKAVWHRGAVDADGKTGDGAGVLVSVPQDFFADQADAAGVTLRGWVVGVPVDQLLPLGLVADQVESVGHGGSSYSAAARAGSALACR